MTEREHQIHIRSQDSPLSLLCDVQQHNQTDKVSHSHICLRIVWFYRVYCWHVVWRHIACSDLDHPNLTYHCVIHLIVSLLFAKLDFFIYFTGKIFFKRTHNWFRSNTKHLLRLKFIKTINIAKYNKRIFLEYTKHGTIWIGSRSELVNWILPLNLHISRKFQSTNLPV